MNTRIGLLAGIAFVQVLLVAGFWLGAGAGGEDAAPLVEFDAAALTAIEISGEEESVRLEKAADGWVVGGVAADDTKVANVLEKIANLDAAWPVATSSASAERFEVTEGKHQRFVRLLAGDDALAEFYLGTSPGYQRVHARAVDSDDVYSVELSNYELGLKVDAWMDKALLATRDEPAEIRVSVPGSGDLAALEATLSRGEEGWLIDGNAADQDEAQTYANRFKTLRVLGVAVAPLEHVATVVVRDDEGEFELKFSREDEESSDYVVESSRVEGAYRVAAYVAEQIMMTDADFLPEAEEVADAEAADTEAASEG